MTENANPQLMEFAKPHPALKRLDVLVGKWELAGRTLDSDVDNIIGWSTFEWMPGGFFLKSEGGYNVNGVEISSTEIIGYDAEQGIFTAQVYSSMSGEVWPYTWDIDGNTLMHAGLGAKYTGTISDDGNTITGGWRPDDGTPVSDGTSYDAVMKRV